MKLKVLAKKGWRFCLIPQKIQRASILPWFGSKPSNVQVEFHSLQASSNCYFEYYRYFIVLFIRVTFTKMGEMK